MSAAPKLLVFLHVAVKQRAFQGELEAALSGIDVTAVGRIGDFDRALGDGTDAVLSLPVVLGARRLSPAIHGRRQGSNEESYALVGVDSTPDLAKIQSIGALDLLGREGTDSFVERLLGAKRKVERVVRSLVVVDNADVSSESENANSIACRAVPVFALCWLIA